MHGAFFLLVVSMTCMQHAALTAERRLASGFSMTPPRLQEIRQSDLVHIIQLLCCNVTNGLGGAVQVALQWMIQRDVGGLAGQGPATLPSLAQEGPAHQL